jgi:hypothetical protein
VGLKGRENSKEIKNINPSPIIDCNSSGRKDPILLSTTNSKLKRYPHDGPGQYFPTKMSLFGGRGPAFHIELESIPPVYHKQPVHHATTPGYTETDPDELRKLCGPSTSGFQTPKTEPTTPSALENSRPSSPQQNETTAAADGVQAVGLMPSVNR